MESSEDCLKILFLDGSSFEHARKMAGGWLVGLDDFSKVGVNGLVFVLGGSRPEAACLAVVEAKEGRSGKISRIPSLPSKACQNGGM